MIPADGLRFAIMETTLQERVRLWDAGPSDSFGPLSGDLPHEIDQYIEQYSPEFTATDDEFVIEATFVNPFGAGEHPWSYGFTIGRTGEADDGYIDVTVDSRGMWGIGMKEEGWLHLGTLPQRC